METVDTCKLFCSHKTNINSMRFLLQFNGVFLNEISLPLFFFFEVPPSIDDSLSSSDVIVREGSNVTLKCRAHGSPQPTIKWKRDDNTKINVNKSLSSKKKFPVISGENLIDFFFLLQVFELDAEVLEVSRISRLDMGAYLCIAQNSVPPSVSKRIRVSVDCE